MSACKDSVLVREKHEKIKHTFKDCNSGNTNREIIKNVVYLSTRKRGTEVAAGKSEVLRMSRVEMK